jgi:hypothetical protein
VFFPAVSSERRSRLSGSLKAWDFSGDGNAGLVWGNTGTGQRAIRFYEKWCFN